MGKYDEALSDLKRAAYYDPKDADTQRLIAEAEAKVRQLVARAQEKERLPETVAISLPTTPPEEPALATTEPTPKPTKPANSEAPPPAPGPRPLSSQPNEPSNTAETPRPPAPGPRPPSSSAPTLNALARALSAAGKHADAVEQFTLALEANPSYAVAYNGRGFALFRLKRHAEAIADFDQAIRLNPSYANAYQNRGVAKRAAGDTAGGDADLAKAKSLLH
jgi:tetratricopeptide (TPR) repeat protein